MPRNNIYIPVRHGLGLEFDIPCHPTPSEVSSNPGRARASGDLTRSDRLFGPHRLSLMAPWPSFYTATLEGFLTRVLIPCWFSS